MDKGTKEKRIEEFRKKHGFDVADFRKYVLVLYGIFIVLGIITSKLSAFFKDLFILVTFILVCSTYPSVRFLKKKGIL